MDFQTRSAKAAKIEQRIHRDELKLARLKTKADKARRNDAGLKLRLGGLLFLLGWQDDDNKILLSRIEKIAQMLKTADDPKKENFKILGENTLKLLDSDNEYDPSPTPLSEEERLALNHHKISLGQILVTYGLDQKHRATVFGALLDFHQSQIAKTSNTSDKPSRPNRKKRADFKTSRS